MIPADVLSESSMTVAEALATTELGFYMGLMLWTAFGLFVAAWLQFKKGPTIGL